MQPYKRGGLISVFAVIILLASAGTALAQFGGIHSKMTSITCGILSGFSVPCDYDTGGPLNENHTVTLSPKYGTAVASCELVGAWGSCTAVCPVGYSRTGCSGVGAINSLDLGVSPAENGCTCAPPSAGLCLVGSCPKATCYSYCLKNAPGESSSGPATVSEGNNGAPTAPSLVSVGQCTIGIPHSIRMQSTDPDNDNIRYGIDWNADGSVDEWVPSSGFVPSGTQQTINKTYSIEVTKTVNVLAQDTSGLNSGWGSVSFTCSALGNNTQNTTINTGSDSSGESGFNSSNGSNGNSGGGIPAAILRLIVPTLVARNTMIKVSWTADNVASCLPVTGTNNDSFAQVKITNTSFASPVGGKTSSPITAATRYTLACVDLNGTTRTKTATVNIQPNFREQ